MTKPITTCQRAGREAIRSPVLTVISAGVEALFGAGLLVKHRDLQVVIDRPPAPDRLAGIDLDFERNQLRGAGVDPDVFRKLEERVQAG